ncbi:MAG TPA: alpha/beta fold hydrolase [Thermoflexales bacterium]|nr:alpha/beta fold hydrolase [Thermoflexales bacterium]HQW33990.1 alpha/beta fold hydrolase [Thermoflexales bacterium]HQZ23543.1 alpha/beta fold hydrolase [Thermoflexales bacterium]
MNEPIILIGGFGSHWSDYNQFARVLANVSGRRVFIVGINRFSWVVGGLLSDYTLLINRTHHAVAHAIQQTGAEKVILVGHSAGGVVARGYLADKAVKQHHVAYSGYERVSRIITLGSPLRAVKSALHPGLDQAGWVDQNYPGAYYAPQVQYLTVSGNLIKGKPVGTPSEMLAYTNYEFIGGDGAQTGDGVVPHNVSSLDGVPSLMLEGIAHSTQWGRWFGSDENTVRLWWNYFDLGDAPLPRQGATFMA